MESESLPKTLAGYQHLESGWTAPGDILVSGGSVVGVVGGLFAGLHVHEAESRAGANVYRKIPVCKQGDNDPEWRECQRAAGGKTQAKAETIHGLKKKDVNDGDLPILEREFAKAKTYDDGKPPLAYLPWAGIDEVAMVQEYGKRKYGEFYNYRKGLEVGRNLSCAIRHIRAYMEGEDNDRESGRSHLAHAACRILFTLQNIHDQTHIDDRFKGTK